MNHEIPDALRQVLQELHGQARLQPGDILVIGCSTSEVLGRKIGTSSDSEIADQLFHEINQFCEAHSIWPAFQCCEHLNRALVIARQAARDNDLEDVSVIPRPGAGGAMASRALTGLKDAVVVEHLANRGRAGIDIGHTLIGMHLRPVVVPVRTQISHIGQAPVVCARTRPKLIGGNRAHYPES